MKLLLSRLAIPAVLVATLLLGGCQNMGMAPMQQKSLYERLGGQGAIVAVVDDFVGNVAADNRINDAQFNALVEDLVKALDKFKVPEKEKGELLGVLGPMKPSIVGQ